MAEARAALKLVLAHSRGGKNADAEKLAEELAGKPDGDGAAAASGRGGRGEAARRAMMRQDRSVRLTPEQVRDALNSRCDTVKVVHCAFDKVRLHHEIETPPDLSLIHI